MTQARQIAVSAVAGIAGALVLALLLGLEPSLRHLAALSALCVPLAVLANQLFSEAAAKGRR